MTRRTAYVSATVAILAAGLPPAGSAARMGLHYEAQRIAKELARMSGDAFPTLAQEAPPPVNARRKESMEAAYPRVTCAESIPNSDGSMTCVDPLFQESDAGAATPVNSWSSAVGTCRLLGKGKSAGAAADEATRPLTALIDEEGRLQRWERAASPSSRGNSAYVLLVCAPAATDPAPPAASPRAERIVIQADQTALVVGPYAAGRSGSRMPLSGRSDLLGACLYLGFGEPLRSSRSGNVSTRTVVIDSAGRISSLMSYPGFYAPDFQRNSVLDHIVCRLPRA
ncbi:MAG: hypothetical protein HY554_00805 [Elusimicrobia bacterium]|nr:hypothetical protein [Elusimicrobiota bacterium]